MRKILFLLLCLPLSAEGFYSAGSFSWEAVKIAHDIPEGEYFRTSVIVGAEKEMFDFTGYAEAEQNTDITKGYLHQFKPYSAEYYIRTGVKYGSIYIEYEHLCVHGVDVYNPDGGHDRFTIGFDTRETN
jgi:hypothetical protein